MLADSVGEGHLLISLTGENTHIHSHTHTHTSHDHSPLKQSILDAMEHLFAKYREILPLFLGPALPMKEEWNMSPYFGVFPFVFKALG